MGKRITAVLLATLAVTSIACGSTGGSAGERQDSLSGDASGGAYLDPGFVDAAGSDGGSMVGPVDGAGFQP